MARDIRAVLFDDEVFAAEVEAAQAVYAARCVAGVRDRGVRASRPAEARGAYVQGTRSAVDRPSRGNWAFDARQARSRYV